MRANTGAAASVGGKGVGPQVSNNKPLLMSTRQVSRSISCVTGLSVSQLYGQQHGHAACAATAVASCLLIARDLPAFPAAAAARPS